MPPNKPTQQREYLRRENGGVASLRMTLKWQITGHPYFFVRKELNCSPIKTALELLGQEETKKMRSEGKNPSDILL
jgi:hypothetical protein